MKLGEIAFVQEVENIKELIESYESKDNPSVNALEAAKQEIEETACTL